MSLNGSIILDERDRIVEGYSALDDCFIDLKLDHTIHVYVSYLANFARTNDVFRRNKKGHKRKERRLILEVSLGDAYLAIVKPRKLDNRQKQGLGPIIREFLMENMLKGRELMACTHYNTYPELEDVIDMYKDKKTQIFKKADKMAYEVSRWIADMLDSTYHEDLVNNIANKKGVMHIGGVEVLLYGLDKYFRLYQQDRH